MRAADSSGRCQERITFCEMDLQCQKPTHQYGGHYVEWHAADGRHRVEWWPGMAELLKGGKQ